MTHCNMSTQPYLLLLEFLGLISQSRHRIIKTTILRRQLLLVKIPEDTSLHCIEKAVHNIISKTGISVHPQSIRLID